MTSPTLRAAVADDYADYVRLSAELAVPDPVPTREEWILASCASTLFMTEGDRALGYGSWTLLGELGHVKNIVVDPSARRRGFGRSIMDAVAERLRALGARRWRLNVKEENLVACRLYERCGMLVTHRSVVLELPWYRMDRLPAARRELRAAPMRAALGVGAAELEVWRAERESRLVMLVDLSDHPVGLARFAPAFPGARPFITDEPDAARPLLEAMAPHRRPQDASVRLVLANQEATVAVLLAAGATALLRLLCYEGELA